MYLDRDELQSRLKIFSNCCTKLSFSWADSTRGFNIGSGSKVMQVPAVQVNFCQSMLFEKENKQILSLGSG